MIKLDDKYSVGISMIDKEHKKIIGILNKAIFAKEHNDSPEEIKEVLKEMTNYALTHIKIEESYMELFNYPYYQDHKEEHRDFHFETKDYLYKLMKGDSQAANEMLEYLKSWLVNHIQGTDKKFIDCCKENGLK